MIRLIYFIPIWILIFILRLVVILLGFVFIPIAVAFKAYSKRKSPINDKEIVLYTSRVMQAWSNLEDGELAGEEFKDKPDWFRILYWSAYRNPASGLRWMPFFSCKIKPEELKFIIKQQGWPVITERSDATFNVLDDAEEGKTIKSFYYLCWQSWFYSNIRFEFCLFGSYRRLWIGHKLYPSAKFVIPEYQAHGAGYGTQFKKVK